MNLRCSPTLADELQDAFIIIDTCTLIDAIKTSDFCELLHSIHKKGCEFFSVDPVKHEFLRGAHSVSEYDNYQTFLETLGISFATSFEKKLDTNDGRTFTLVFNKYYENKHVNKQPSYVDMLLLFMVYFYRTSTERVFLMTSNHHDIPGFFARKELIVFEEHNEIRTEAIYQLDIRRVEQKLDLLLKAEPQTKEHN